MQLDDKLCSSKVFVVNDHQNYKHTCCTTQKNSNIARQIRSRKIGRQLSATSWM